MARVATRAPKVLPLRTIELWKTASTAPRATHAVPIKSITLTIHSSGTRATGKKPDHLSRSDLRRTALPAPESLCSRRACTEEAVQHLAHNYQSHDRTQRVRACARE